jgi:hypothetical protein
MMDRYQSFATHLTLRFKELYDAKFTARVLIRDDGRVGFTFRLKDPFNFYVFEMNRIGSGRGYKRIRKFVNGVPTIIYSIDDGGYL